MSDSLAVQELRVKVAPVAAALTAPVAVLVVPVGMPCRGLWNMNLTRGA